MARAEAAVWFPALNGDLVLGGGARFQVEGLDLDETQVAPALDLRFYNDKWTIGFNGFVYSLDDENDARTAIDFGSFAVAAGDEVDADIDIGLVEGWVGYRIWEAPLTDSRRANAGEPAPASDEVWLGLDVLGGVRLMNVSMDFEAVTGGAAGQSAGFDQTWVDPFIGARLGLRASDWFTMGISGNIGGFTTGDDSSFSWEVRPSFEIAFNPNITLEVGFRHVQFHYDEGGSDGDDIENALAGLFGALVIRF